MDLILYAVPFFFVLILLEFVYGLARQRNTYRLNDTINSLSLGSLSRLQGLVILGISTSVYAMIVAKYQLTQLPDDQLWVWIICFVLYDLVYYWKHRLGHEMALFWGSHVAHHQSEDYNLGTALRQTSVDFYGFLFYLPFFVLGFPAQLLFTVVSLNLIYQFWVHTEHVPKLGILEWIFITPSNHRVHHARNPIYVDRNYGGVFIVWDRLFGSFQEELDEEAVVFGLRKPLNSWNPVWANVHVYWRLLQDFLKAPGLTNKLKICFMPPGWQPAGMETSCKLKRQDIDLAGKFDPTLSNFDKIYTFVQFVITVMLSLYVLINTNSLGYTSTTVAVIFLSYSFYVHGIWLESRRSTVPQECIRLTIFIIMLQVSGASLVTSGVLSAYALLSLAIVVLIRNNKLTPVFKQSP